MKKFNSEKSNIFLQVASALLVLVLLAASLMSGILARYTTTMSGTAGAPVANYAFDFSVTNSAEQTATIDISDISATNPQKVYTITVTNTKDGKTADVTQTCNIDVELVGTVPISYTVELQNEGNSNYTTANSVNLPAATSTTRSFRLTVKYDESKFVSGVNAEIYNDISVLTVRVNAEQVD